MMLTGQDFRGTRHGLLSRDRREPMVYGTIRTCYTGTFFESPGKITGPEGTPPIHSIQVNETIVCRPMSLGCPQAKGLFPGYPAELPFSSLYEHYKLS
jgi:hypothetical protein